MRNIHIPYTLISKYLQGKLRYYIYNTRFRFLIRRYIQEQYEYRLRTMNKRCLKRGSCIHCGCDTPELQFSNDKCEGACYTKMLSKKHWKIYKALL
jgi:hypothetical protein